MSLMGDSDGGIHTYGDTGIGAKRSLCLPYVGAMGYAMPSVCRQMAVPRAVWEIGWGCPYIWGYMDMIDVIPMPAVWGVVGGFSRVGGGMVTWHGRHRKGC